MLGLFFFIMRMPDVITNQRFIVHTLFLYSLFSNSYKAFSVTFGKRRDNFFSHDAQQYYLGTLMEVPISWSIGTVRYCYLFILLLTLQLNTLVTFVLIINF